MCMEDSTAGFSSKDAEDPNQSIRFCGEECKSFHSCAFQPSFSVQRPSNDITNTLISDVDPDGYKVQSVHLQSIVFSSCGEGNQSPPIHATADVYQVKEGHGHLLSGCSFVLFDLRTPSNRIHGEYFLTDELQLDKPLAHVKTVQIDEKQHQLLNDVLRESILKSAAN